jgi:hypothetical protein
MGKILLGLVAGIALTSLAFLVFDEAGNAPADTGESTTVRRLADEVTETGAASTPQNGVREEAARPNGVEKSVASANADSQTSDLTARSPSSRAYRKVEQRTTTNSTHHASTGVHLAHRKPCFTP